MLLVRWLCQRSHQVLRKLLDLWTGDQRSNLTQHSPCGAPHLCSYLQCSLSKLRHDLRKGLGQLRLGVLHLFESWEQDLNTSSLHFPLLVLHASQDMGDGKLSHSMALGLSCLQDSTSRFDRCWSTLAIELRYQLVQTAQDKWRRCGTCRHPLHSTVLGCHCILSSAGKRGINLCHDLLIGPLRRQCLLLVLFVCCLALLVILLCAQGSSFCLLNRCSFCLLYVCNCFDVGLILLQLL
mmetsp:Transcript_11856/g.26981  ORF Transcript_11856/g.26981 Transcript_11856/m.26981 type:complete len:238 (-) Transcript_11856:282-995(-)